MHPCERIRDLSRVFLAAFLAATAIQPAAVALAAEPASTAPAQKLLLTGTYDREFIDRYGEDGGCNEGPSYWDEAGGAMLVFLELLRSRTDGRIDIYGHPKIAAMGRYIASAQMDGPWFANFADADARSRHTLGKIYRFGERTGSDALKNLALLSLRQGQCDGPIDPPLRLSRAVCPLVGPLMELFWIPAEAQPKPLDRPVTVWLPDLQVLFARQSPQAGQGLVLESKRAEATATSSLRFHPGVATSSGK